MQKTIKEILVSSSLFISGVALAQPVPPMPPSPSSVYGQFGQAFRMNGGYITGEQFREFNVQENQIHNELHTVF